MPKFSFNKVGGLRPRRNNFDLSHRKNFTCNMGELIPVLCDMAIPGDTWRIANEVTVRFHPLVAPVMHEFYCTTHTFFVPFRLLYPEVPFTPSKNFASNETLFEAFIQQGITPLVNNLPRFNANANNTSIYSLWDYFGFPVSNFTMNPPGNYVEGVDFLNPLDMPWRAYNLVYNEYYADEAIGLHFSVSLTNPNVLRRAWAKDYFTAARPSRQRGTAPALPVNVNISSVATSNLPVAIGGLTPAGSMSNFPLSTPVGAVPGDSITIQTSTLFPGNGPVSPGNLIVNPVQIANALQASSTTFNVSDLRLAFQTQKWLERNERAGTRYTSFLRSHFGVSPRDERLNRPEYIGGTHNPVVITEVLQTSVDGGNQGLGNMGGHGLGADGNFVGKYHVQEYGIILTMFSVMPKAAYQDGINRQWLYRRPTDFYFPELAHLSEQGIYRAEIASRWCLAGNVGDAGADLQIFGYTGQYDEHRIKHDMVCADMRLLNGSGGGSTPTLPYWNFARKFENQNVFLNPPFVACTPRTDPFQVQGIRHVIANVYNRIVASRPMPVIAEPGLVDHF